MKNKTVWVYWIFTFILAYEMLAGSMWALLHIEFDMLQFVRLGYPGYMLSILGAWKLGGGIVILLPRLRRLKEWAYAGAFFDFSGAVASQLIAGLPRMWEVPAFYVVVTLVSWALRPDERRLPAAAEEGHPTISAWAVPVGVAAAMLVLALLTLPKGMSPSGAPAW